MKKIIGRDFKQCDYTIYDPEKRVSRVHLVAEKNENGFSLFDKSSSNGTYVNGVKIPHNELIQIKQEDKVTEQLSLEPLTDYSKFKMLCEEIILEKHSSDFVCTVLRPATVCGVSPRQRFDLSVNILTNHAVNLGKITVFGGSQSRPNLDIRDMARAYLHVLQHKDKVTGEVFNVGGENLTLDKIAEKVKHQLGESAEIQHKITDDLRSYRVDSSKILSKIGFKPSYSIDDSIRDLKIAFSNGEFKNSLENPMYFNIKRMKELSLA